MKTTSTQYFLCAITMLCFFTLPLPGNHSTSYWGLICPGDTTVSCLSNLHNLSSFGQAVYKDHHGEHDAGPPEVKYNLGKCNTGTITRTWKYMDAYWRVYTCTQTIYVTGENSFNQSHITWPADLEVSGCYPDISPGALNSQPEWKYVPCSQIMVSKKDQWFNFKGACKKIIRTWTVVDWCIYDPIHKPYQGIWVRNQVIKVTYDEEPHIICPEDVSVMTTHCSSAEVQVPPLQLTEGQCTENIDIQHNSAYAFKKGADISGNYPVGKTKVTYTITYGCGNKIKCNVDIEVKSNKAPTPYCINFTAIVLMGMDSDGDGINDEGMVEITAKSLDKGSVAYCNGGPLKFSFSKDPDDHIKAFTCDDVGINEVPVWVTDKFGNQDFCVVTISVQNNAANIQDCEENNGGDSNSSDDEGDDEESMMILAGRVADVFGNQYADVAVEVVNMRENTIIDSAEITITEYKLMPKLSRSGALLYMWIPITSTEMQYDTTTFYVTDTVITSEKGLFLYESNDGESPGFEIRAIAPDWPQIPVDMDDVEMVFQHVSGQYSFEHPFQYLAADVDCNGIVDFDDISEMIEWIAGERETFSCKGYYKIFSEGDMSALDNHTPTSDSYFVASEEGKTEGLDFLLVPLGKLIGSEDKLRGRWNSRSSNLSVNQILSFDKEVLRKNLEDVFGENQSAVIVFPNPVHEQANMDIYNASESHNTSVNIFGTDGRLIARQNLQLIDGLQQHTMDMSGFPTGLYFYHVQLGDKIFSGKILKE